MSYGREDHDDDLRNLSNDELSERLRTLGKQVEQHIAEVRRRAEREAKQNGDCVRQRLD
jgi:hypothetical protein